MSSARSVASWTRSLTPSVCIASSVTCAPTRLPSLRAIARTSVRYSSPCALSVVSRLQAVAQRGRVEDVDAGVDLVDLPLLRRRVLVLDDPGDRAVRARDDPPVAGRVRHPRGQHRDRVAVLVVLGDQLAQRLRLSSGTSPDVTITEPSKSAGSGGRARPGPRHRCRAAAPGRRSWLRVDILAGGPRPVRGRCRPRRPGVRGQCPGGDHGVPDETAPADLVQHLRGRRFHPGSQTGGHDDDRRGTMGSHAVFSSSSLRVFWNKYQHGHSLCVPPGVPAQAYLLIRTPSTSSPRHTVTGLTFPSW